MNLIDTGAYLTDTHAHLNFEEFKNDYREVISSAFKNNVKTLIIPSSNLETSKKAIEIAEKYDTGVYAAVGLHPIHAKDEEFIEEEFLKMVQNKKVVAVGETGLDNYYDSSNSELQKEVLRAHINLAQKYNKPLILHSRDAGEDLLSVLMEGRADACGVVHCFEEDWPFAKVVLDMGLYLSFNGLITFTKKQKTIDVIQNAPLDRLLIETDSPWLTPEPYRGKRNEPVFVIEVAKKIAEIKKISIEEVVEQTSQNAIKLFKREV